MQFRDLKKQYEVLRPQMDAAMLEASGAARRYMRRLTAFDGEVIRRGITNLGQPVNAPLIAALERECEGRRLSWKDVWLRGLELCAEAMGFRVDAVYDAEALLRRIRAFCEDQEFAEKFDDAGLQAVAKKGDRALLAFLYQRLKRAGAFPPEAVRRLSEHAGVAAGAMLLGDV